MLLDEVGSGTDPIEGGALGVAIVDHFRRRGATVIATSHYDALKTYASTTDGRRERGVRLRRRDVRADLRSCSTDRRAAAWRSRSPARLGLNPSIIAAARQNLSAREAQLAEHLAKIDRDMRALEHEQRLAARERETLEAAEARMREREDALRQREETFRQRLNEELETQVRQARREIDDVIAELKAKTTAIAHEAPRQALTTGDTGAVRADARAAVDAVVRRFARAGRASPRAGRAAGRAPAVGDRVIVGGLGLEGRRHGRARRHGGARRARQAHARRRPRSARASAARRAASRVNVHVELQPRDGARVGSERRSAAPWTRRSRAPSGFSTSRC